MTLSSIIQWFSFFDVGIGNGLRNKLAEAIASGDKTRAKIYISSSFAFITAIAIILFLVFTIISRFVSWNMILNTYFLSNEELFETVAAVFLFFCLGFVFGTLSSVLQAMQLYAINDIIGLITQFLGLIAIFVLVNTTESSLFLLCLVYSAKTVVVLGFANLILFSRSLKDYRPSIKFISWKNALPLLSLGFKFFIGQILYLIVNQSSLVIIVQFFGPKEVTVYNLALRYISIISMGFMIVLTPLLSAFTEAYTKKDINWIKRTMKRVNFIWFISALFTLALILFYKLFFQLWIGNKVEIPLTLIIGLACSSILSNSYVAFSLFLNGIGKISLQLYFVGSQALLFFPLSFIFYKFNFSLLSIVFPQILFSLFGVIIFSYQYKKIINETATGVWNK